MPRALISHENRAVGVRLSALRKARGLSQMALGKASGVSFQQIQKYEKGINRITPIRLRKIAALLQVKPTDLTQADTRDARRIDEVVGFLAGDLMAAFVKIESRDARKLVVRFVKDMAKSGMSREPKAVKG